MKFISEADAALSVTLPEALAAIEAAFISHAEGSAHLFPVIRSRLEDRGALTGVKSAYDAKGGVLGLKTGGYWPGNVQKGFPTHQSTVLLLDPDTGRPSALVGANHLTALRTAAAAALSVRHLARADAGVLAVIGAGAQAGWHVRAILLAQPSLRRVVISNRTPARAQALVAQLQSEGIAASAADIETACRSADVIATVTGAAEPLVKQAWIRPGAHLACMGADSRGKQEVDAALLASATVFTDDREQSVTLGEAQTAFRKGMIIREDIYLLGDVLRGAKRGRTDDEAITLYDGIGVALQDLAMAALAVRHAEATAVAVEVAF